jgi:hypothetical protein
MRKWLQPLVNEYLSAVTPLSHAEDDRAQAIVWALWMRQHWSLHGLADLKQQRNLMTDVRNAIKSRLGTDHVALETMNFTVAEWTTINQPISQQVARRNENVVLLENPDAIVALAVRLLESRHWADIAAGLVVLTGRRSSEILATAEFKMQSQWSVRFTGALKRRGEVQRLSFEIPTLTTAERVVKALDKLRAICPSHGLSAQQINQKYAHAVAAACDRHFCQLVPKREGREHLFTHLFRSVYAAIATLWFAPMTVDANEYKAAIQGHYAILEEPDSDLRRSLAASRHYNDYKIADAQGNIDGRQGLKLGHGGVRVIEAFNPLLKQEGEEILVESLGQSLEQGNRFAALDHSPPLNNLVGVEDTRGEEEQTVSQQAIHDAAIHLADLPRLMADESPAIEVIPPRKRSNRPRLKQVNVDLDLLKSVAGHFGVEVRKGKGKGYDQALLELLLRLEQRTISEHQTLASAHHTQTIALQAKTLAWLTDRVQHLEAQLLHPQKGTIDEEHEIRLPQLDSLSNENLRLKEELQQTRSKLDSIQQFLSGAESQGGALRKQTMMITPQMRSLSTHGSASSPLTTTISLSDQAKTSRGTIDNDALSALHAIIDFNDHFAASHRDRWAISFPVMKDLLKQVGKATQSKIDSVLKEYKDIILDHHKKHGLGARHNRVHQGKSISHIIKL